MSPTFAVITQRSRLSRPALDAAVDTAARSLRGAGIHAHHRVGLCGDSTAEYVALLLALASLDATVVVLDPRSYPTVGAAVAALDLDHVVLPRAIDRLRHMRTWRDGAAGCPLHATADLLVLPPGDVPESVDEPQVRTEDLESWPWAARDGALVQTTSGSTGTPTVVPKRPGHMLANCRRTAEVVGYREDDVLAPVLPLDHQYGLSVLFIGLLLGLPVVATDPARVHTAVRLATRHGATVVDSTPQAHAAIVRGVHTGRLRAATLAGVRLWCVGGGPTPGSLHAEAQKVHGRPLLDGYGSTELGNVAHVDPADPGALRALPGVELRVIGEDGSASHDWGRLLVRTPDAPTGADGWYTTDDLARIDASGRLVVAGRYQAIDRNGIVVHPASLEHQLAGAGIHAVCVSVESRRPGQSPKVVVVVEDPFRRRPPYWRDRVSTLLPALERPDRVLAIPQLPRTSGGTKVDRRRVRRWAEALEHHPDLAVTGMGRSNEEITGRAPLPGTLAALTRTRHWITEHQDDLVDILADASSVPAARIEIQATLAALDSALADFALHQPPRVPTSWVYMPANVLLYSYALYLLVPALWTQSFVFRPSSRVTPTTLALHEALAPVHGLEVRPALCSQAKFAALRGANPGVVVFTGRYDNAESVRAGLTPGQIMVFFGQGSNPIVVGAGADASLAAQDCVSMRLLNSGQDCFAPDLILLHADIAEDVLTKIVDRLDALESTPRRTSESAVLRRTAPDDLARIAHHVGTYAERIVHGGRMNLARRLIHPTVLLWPIAEAPPQEEMFAPVFNILVWDDEEQVRELLDTEHYRDRSMCISLYGVTDELARWCDARLTVSIDATIVATDDPALPFGGLGRRANYTATTTTVDVGPVLVSASTARHRAELRPAAPAAASLAPTLNRRIS